MIFTDDIADDAGAFLVGFVMSVAELMHRPQHAPVNGLEPVPHVRQSTSYDYGHRIVEVRAPHLVFDVYMIAFRTCFHPVGLSSTIRPPWAVSSNFAELTLLDKVPVLRICSHNAVSELSFFALNFDCKYGRDR